MNTDDEQPKISVNESQTIEMWLPKEVVEAISTNTSSKHLCVVQDRDISKIVWYVSGLEVYRETAETEGSRYGL